MRLKFFLFFVSIFIFDLTFGQQLNFGLAYQNMYVKQWDQAIQTYNFSRPYLVEKQPLLQHATNLECQYIFNSSKNYYSGITTNYSYLRSSAKNQDYDVAFNAHFIKLGYTIHYENQKHLDNFYIDLSISALATLMNKSIKDERVQIDDENLKALGLGDGYDINIGYKFKALQNRDFSVYGGVGYTSYFWSPQSEAVLNQTIGLSSKIEDSIFAWKIGLKMHFDYSKKTNPNSNKTSTST